MKRIEIYHGSSQIVSEPEIRIAKYHKDFYYGFYCTMIRNQAVRWATRFGEACYISFHTIAALQTIRFIGEGKVYG